MLQPEILPVDQWISDEGDSIQLRDPVSGEPIDPQRPPEFLLRDGRLRDGGDYIAELLSRSVALGIYYGTGERNAADLGDSVFEDIIIDPRTNVHMLGHTVDGVRHDAQGSRLLVPNGYSERISGVAESAKLATFCVGLEVDLAGQPASQPERILQAIQDAASLEIHQFGEDNAVTQALGIVAANAAQWYRVLRAGEAIQNLRSTQPIYSGAEMNNAMLVAPISGSDYTRKFQALGMENVSESADPASFTGELQFEAAAMETGRIRLEDL